MPNENNENYVESLLLQNTLCHHCHSRLRYASIVRLEAHTVNGHSYCTRCYANLTRCHRCNHIIDELEDSFESGDFTYCEPCYTSHLRHCEECNDEIFIYRNNNYLRYNGNYYCPDCQENNFTFCVSCGSALRNEDALFLHDDSEDAYCEECYRRARHRSEIREYSYKPTPHFYAREYEKKQKKYSFFGIELEVETKDSGADVSSALKKLKEELKRNKLENYYYFKEDASLNNGLEVVTHPSTYKYLKELKFYELLKNLSSLGFMSYDSDHCGLHVHTDKNCFTSFEISKLRIFFIKYKNELFKLSKRKSLNNEYCRYEDSSLINGIIEDCYYESGGRYKAINLNNQETLEFRLFNGTLCHFRFIATMQFLECLTNFIHICGLGDILTGSAWLELKEYAKNSNRYNHFLKFCKKEGI